MQQLKRPSTAVFSSKAPPVVERQKVVNTEASRYDYLKKAAGAYRLIFWLSFSTNLFVNVQNS